MSYTSYVVSACARAYARSLLCEVYSFGLLLFETVARTPPFSEVTESWPRACSYSSSQRVPKTCQILSILAVNASAVNVLVVNSVSPGVSYSFQCFCAFLGGFDGFLVTQVRSPCFPRYRAADPTQTSRWRQPAERWGALGSWLVDERAAGQLVHTVHSTFW